MHQIEYGYVPKTMDRIRSLFALRSIYVVPGQKEGLKETRSSCVYNLFTSILQPSGMWHRLAGEVDINGWCLLITHGCKKVRHQCRYIFSLHVDIMCIFFMFVPCINSIKALSYYSKLMHTIIKSEEY